MVSTCLQNGCSGFLKSEWIFCPLFADELLDKHIYLLKLSDDNTHLRVVYVHLLRSVKYMVATVPSIAPYKMEKIKLTFYARWDFTHVRWLYKGFVYENFFIWCLDFTEVTSLYSVDVMQGDFMQG